MAVIREPPARDCSAGCQLGTDSRLSAGGRPAQVVFCPPGPPRGTAQFGAEPTENFVLHLCCAKSRDDTGKPEPHGLVVRASQPAKCLSIQKESWSPRGDAP